MSLASVCVMWGSSWFALLPTSLIFTARLFIAAVNYAVFTQIPDSSCEVKVFWWCFWINTAFMS